MGNEVNVGYTISTGATYTEILPVQRTGKLRQRVGTSPVLISISVHYSASFSNYTDVHSLSMLSELVLLIVLREEMYLKERERKKKERYELEIN